MAENRKGRGKRFMQKNKNKLYWRNSSRRKNKRLTIKLSAGKFKAAGLGIMFFLLAGCGQNPQTAERTADLTENEKELCQEDGNAEAESIADVYRDIYDKAVETDTIGSLEVTERIVARLGDNGYVAVDSNNQINMTNAEQAVKFCSAASKKEMAELTIVVVADSGGFTKYDLETENGTMNIARGYYQYDKNGNLNNSSIVSYPADWWQYTEEGYLLFEGNYFSDENYVLTLNDTPEHTALRVMPLEKRLRELNQKYVLPAGYGKSNMFFLNWSRDDFGDLDFYDIFDTFYPMLYKQPVPYAADENLGNGSRKVYQIPEEEFENVILTYFPIEKEALRTKTTYISEAAAYEYRPRGFYEARYPDIPYPEVVDYEENQDGTITLFINAVYPDGNTSKLYSHKAVVRPMDDDRFQYVSNQMLLSGEQYKAWWYSERLTEDEWKEIYSENEFSENEGDCLLTEAEKEELKNAALEAAELTREVYKDVEIIDGPSFGSNIKGFTKEQCRKVVSLLGNGGYVSVTEDTNMENYKKVEDFYAAYMEKREAMVTIYNVNPDGLLGAVTFVYRDNRLQTYYVGIGWQKGGIPEIRNTLVSHIEEIKLTEKGYFIYAFENVIPHSSLRQYWRIKPLSEKCRELTEKYISGLSYVNYNVLVTNWDSSNVEDILMPCMFEDIYRIYTGENFNVQNRKIPADTYEKIMTACFPVSTEVLREKCGYDGDSNSYEYEMIFASPYPPFGEVVDFMKNGDGTITLIVDAVWADYNSDIAFTNRIVVQPFEDGTFRYLSNSIEQKELEIPTISK